MSKQTSAHAFTSVAADYSAIETARSVRGDVFRREEGFSLTGLAFVAAAACIALREHPALNAGVRDDAVHLYRSVNLAIAVDLDHQGLVVPVIRDADARSVRGLARSVRDLASRARARRLGPDDLVGGTFTITNPGSYGTERSVPIINQPQVGILSTDGVRKRVVVDPATGMLTIRPIGQLCLSFDARAVEPEVAGAFLTTVQCLIEQTAWVDAL